MKPVLALCLCVAVNPVLHAQNLVPNGSFEDTTACPDYFGQWWRAAGWENNSNQTPDYFNACAGGVVCGVPFNHMGYQAPAHGEAYMGMATYAYNDYDYREIIAAELVQPLQPGVPVYISFKTSCGGYGSIFWNSAKWKARGPGLKFFMDLPTDWSAYLYPNSAAVYMDTVLADTSATWVTVSGAYVPDSAYRYVAITNFFEDSLSWPSIQDTVYGTLGGSYAFVDDVCVSPEPNYCAGLAAVEQGQVGTWVVLSDPIAGQLTLTCSRAIATGDEVQVCDAIGRRLYTVPWPPGATTIHLSTTALPPGHYVLSLPRAHRTFMFVHVSP